MLGQCDHSETQMRREPLAGVILTFIMFSVKAYHWPRISSRASCLGLLSPRDESPVLLPDLLDEPSRRNARMLMFSYSWARAAFREEASQSNISSRFLGAYRAFIMRSDLSVLLVSARQTSLCFGVVYESCYAGWGSVKN